MKNGYDKIDDIFKEGLDNILINPPENVFDNAYKKSNISKKGKFNPGYLFYCIAFISVVAISSTVFYVANKNTKIETATQAVKTINPNIQESISNEIINVKEINNEIASINNTNNYMTGNSNEKSNATDLAITSQEIINADKNVEQIEESLITETTNIAQTKIAKSELISENIASPYNLNNYLTSATANQNTNKEQEINNILVNTIAANNLIKMTPLSLISLPFNNPIIFTADFHFPDTFKFKQQKWSVDLSLTNSVINTTIASLNPENDNFVNDRNEALYNSLSFHNISILVNYHKRILSFSAGFSFTQFTEKTNYGIVLTNPQDAYDLVYNGTDFTYTNNNNYYYVDTNSYWHYTYLVDSIMHKVDSVQEFKIDTNLVFIYDTLNYLLFDTADYSNLRAGYSIFEFPIWASIDINRGNIGYAISAGLIPGLLVKRTGSLIKGNTHLYLPDNVLPLRKFVLSGGIKMNFYYYPNTRIKLYAGPELRFSLINAANNNSQINYKWQSWGINTGIRYYFNN